MNRALSRQREQQRNTTDRRQQRLSPPAQRGADRRGMRTWSLIDRLGQPVACALFGSAAWHCAARDAFLGWDRATRARHLHRLTSNTRFLIPAWVQVPQLASHVLGLIARRIRTDWQAKYGHPVDALETFVDRGRFQGTCYRAANWRRLGVTQGRTRNDRAHRICAAVKDVYLYPLVADVRRALGAG